MIYCARLAGVQAELKESQKGHHDTLILAPMCGGEGRGQSVLSNQTRQDGIRRLVRGVNLLFRALNTGRGRARENKRVKDGVKRAAV